MNAIILSAGYGVRLWPLTQRIPKVMIEVGGRPVLEHQVFYLHKYGVFNIVVNLHHLPLKVMEHFGSNLLYTYEPTLFGEEMTVDYLAQQFPFIRNEYLVVLNGDTLTNLNLEKMFRLSKGKSVRYMDGDVYAGVKILAPAYHEGNRKIIDYQDTEASWIDIGMPVGLARARKDYEEKFNKMS